MTLRYPDNDAELADIVRGATSYEDTADELPQSQLDVIIAQAKGKVELKTNSDQWYSDDGLGYALAAYTSMRAKAAVENVPLSSYSFGDETVDFDPDSIEDSAQYQQFAQDVRDGLDASAVDDDTGLKMQNSTNYIGTSYTDPHEYK